MKQHWLIALSLVSLMAMAAWAATADTQPSLMSNGDFSIDSKSAGWPDDWPHPEGTTWEKEGDLHFLRLATSRPGQTVMVYRAVALPSPTPPALEIRLRLRYTGVTAGEKNWFDARVINHFKNKSGKVLVPEPPTPAFLGSSDGWIDRSYFVKVPVSARLLEIMPTMFQAAAGTLDLAQCQVFPATVDQLPKPPPIIPSTQMVPGNPAALPPELHVAGNQLQTKDGKAEWLQGLCVDSLQWSAAGENRIPGTVGVAIDQWKANVIRLPVIDSFWFGRPAHNQRAADGGMKYRQIVDAAVEAAASRGAYIAIDLHSFGAPMDEHIDFWKDVATRYKDHPAVMFELFNEPHDISWKLWRDGGNLEDPGSKHADNAVVENSDQLTGETSPGMQALLDAVRGTGARNIIIAGGLAWSYDLSAVVSDYPLVERPGGNGIMYSWHVYPWKKDWDKAVLGAAAKYPIFVGEVGCPQKWEDFAFIKPDERYEKLGPDCPWPADILGFIQKNKLNWTGFSFHPHCGPMVISDWNFTPTPYWGVFVKDALAGKQFEMKNAR